MTKGKNTRPWSWVPTLYFAEGLPYAIVTTLTVVMYKRMGLSNADLAFYTSLMTIPWVIKPIWSPIVDIFSTKLRWIVAMQALIAVAMGCVAFTLPGPVWLSATVASFMVTAFLSSTHDISADGFYMLALTEKDQSLFVGIRTTFYRVAMLLGQGPLLIFADFLEGYYGHIPSAWATLFEILSGCFALLAIYHAWVLPRPTADVAHRATSLASVWREFGNSFTAFFRKPHILITLLFLLLYKLPEAQLQKLISPFLLDDTSAGGLGLTTAQVGYCYGTLGIIGLLAGGIFGGIVVANGGLRRWIIPMAWTLTASCATMVLLAYIPEPSLLTINICVVIEQLGYGFSTTAYILYCIHISSGRYATSHYAIATAFMSLGMMLPGMAAGAIEQIVGYGPFFIWALLCCVATLAVSFAAKIWLDN